MEEQVSKKLTRRQMLKLSGTVAAGSVLAAVTPAAAAQVANETVHVPDLAQAAQEMVYEVLPPYGHPTMKVLAPPKRPDTLDGKTVCGLMGGLFHFEETWPVIVEVLKKKYPTAKFVGPADIAKDFKGSTVVLNATTGGIPSGWDAKDPQLVANIIKQFKCDVVISGNGC